jgi:8-oxo-dGTP diphosphatase
VSGPTRPTGLHRQPGDGWVACACGGRHWGLNGAAGLLLFRTDDTGRADAVVLQHRAEWSDHGGTWGIPGGAIAPGETAVGGAVREAAEESGIDPGALEVVTTRVLDHGPWSYTTVIARATGPHDPRATDPESVEVRWVAVDDVAARRLHPGFGAAWSTLRELLP